MNTMAAHVAIAVGVRGPMLTLNQAGVAGDLAVARAVGLIAAGRATAVLAGGVDELCGVLYRELARLSFMSVCDPGPEGCWPFDRRANGTVLGEGATVLLLETADQAAARGARAYAEVAGVAWGNLPAPAHGFPPRRGRDAAVVRRALAAAGVGPGDVDVVCLTGGGHPEQDACELDLIEDALGGDARPCLTAVTPLCGEHGGAGALRVAVTAALALADGRLPPLPDLQEPIRALDFVTPVRVKGGPARIVLVHGLARGGGHVALVLRPPAARAEAA
jgi:3-oxoacyl-[acyl-carrier-protein] synthase II